jgi:hypothetical protein
MKQLIGTIENLRIRGQRRSTPLLSAYRPIISPGRSSSRNTRSG